MTEEQWHPLIAQSLARTLGLRPEFLLPEVPTRDGSRADLVYVYGRRVVVFEVKGAEAGEAAAVLDARALRQLRHFADGADAVYLVTVATPRQLSMSPDARVVVAEPLEAQLVPEGVGWVLFDRLSLAATVVKPAAELAPKPEARRHLCDEILARLGRVQASVKECRQR